MVARDRHRRTGYFHGIDSLIDQRIDGSLLVQGRHGCMDGTAESVGVSEGLMGQMVRLEIVPDNLDVVELGCVFWQPLGGEPVFARLASRSCPRRCEKTLPLAAAPAHAERPPDCRRDRTRGTAPSTAQGCSLARKLALPAGAVKWTEDLQAAATFARLHRNDWLSVRKQALVSMSAARDTPIGPKPRQSPRSGACRSEGPGGPAPANCEGSDDVQRTQ